MTGMADACTILHPVILCSGLVMLPHQQHILQLWHCCEAASQCQWLCANNLDSSIHFLSFFADAQHVTTIEFRTTESHIPRHRMLKPLDWALEWTAGSLEPVDFAFSFSSWEHDGLGRYGDPLDPWGDVEAVARTSCFVKPGERFGVGPASRLGCAPPAACCAFTSLINTCQPDLKMRQQLTAHIYIVFFVGGLLFFGAPMSTSDQLQYNAHRIYGFIRLPLVTANWEVVGVYEQDSAAGSCGLQTCHGVFDRWNKKAPIGSYGFQPVVVLRNLRTSPCQLQRQELVDM